MILGVAGLVPSQEVGQKGSPTDADGGDWEDINENVVKSVIEHGFKTVQVRVTDTKKNRKQNIERIKFLFSNYDMPMSQTVGNYGGGLISENPVIRNEAINFMKEMIIISSELGSPNTYLRPGSINKNGPWFPHKENNSKIVWDRLVNSTREICDFAEIEGIKIALEGGVSCPISSPIKVKSFFDDVNSSMLGLNMDPVNFISSLDVGYNSTKLINDFFSLVPNKIWGAHAKDFKIIDSLIPHFEESIIGDKESLLDNVALLKGMEKFCPNGHVLVEHLPDELIPFAKKGIDKIAKENNITWE